MNFVCSILPDCRLWIEHSASFHHFSSAWIPKDINAAIAACLFLQSTRLSLPTPIGSECRLSLLSSGPILFASSTWKMSLPTAWSEFLHILNLHFAFHSNLQPCSAHENMCVPARVCVWEREREREREPENILICTYPAIVKFLSSLTTHKFLRTSSLIPIESKIEFGAAFRPKKSEKWSYRFRANQK